MHGQAMKRQTQWLDFSVGFLLSRLLLKLMQQLIVSRWMFDAVVDIYLWIEIELLLCFKVQSNSFMRQKLRKIENLLKDLT